MTIIKETREDLLAQNPIVEEDVIVYELDSKRFKVGDGSSRYKDLDYVVDPMIPYMFQRRAVDKITNVLAIVITFIILLIPTYFSQTFRELVFIYQAMIFAVVYLICYLFISKKIEK